MIEKPRVMEVVLAKAKLRHVSTLDEGSPLTLGLNARHLSLMYGIPRTTYGPVEQFQDPYSDCSGPEGLRDAFGAGVCCQAQGSTRSVDTECAGTLCVEGVCCDGSCDSPCESCVASLSTASDDGVCAPSRNGVSIRHRFCFVEMMPAIVAVMQVNALPGQVIVGVR